VPVLDRADAGRDGVAYGRVRVRVREDVLSDRVGLLDGGAHLGDRELGGVELVGGRHGAARGHDLELVHVPADLLASSLADLGLPVGDRADHAARQDIPDAVVLDDDRGALLRVGAGAVDEERVRENGQAHRATTFASYIQTFSSARGDHSTWLATP